MAGRRYRRKEKGPSGFAVAGKRERAFCLHQETHSKGYHKENQGTGIGMVFLENCLSFLWDRKPKPFKGWCSQENGPHSSLSTALRDNGTPAARPSHQPKFSRGRGGEGEPFGKGPPSPPRTPPFPRENFDWRGGRAEGVPLKKRKAVNGCSQPFCFAKEESSSSCSSSSSSSSSSFSSASIRRGLLLSRLPTSRKSWKRRGPGEE